MFGQDGQSNDNNTQGSSTLPFDPSAVSLSSSAPEPAATPTPSPEPVTAPTPAAAPTGDNDDLLSIKQTALQQLSPLVSHLDQTPEEQFRTTMMMIQASDDQSLIKTAYDAAQKITDDKVRAQALLDIINEINYFTQQAAED